MARGRNVKAYETSHELLAICSHPIERACQGTCASVQVAAAICMVERPDSYGLLIVSAGIL
jgi:hypothetical protein